MEAGAQARMAAQKRLCSGLERLRIQGAFQPEYQLHRVKVRRLGIIEGMEQQTFLQRRERQNLLEVGVFALQPVDLGLGERNQRQIGRGAALSLADGGSPSQSDTASDLRASLQEDLGACSESGVG